MIDRAALLRELKALTATLVEDLTRRSEEVAAVQEHVRGEYSRAKTAGRTDRSYVEWREDLLNQVAVAWVLACVFVRFCEDNRLVDDPLLSGPGERRRIAQDHRLAWLTERPEAGDREWLQEVFSRYRQLPATAELFADTNPLWQVGPSADGAKALIEVWWRLDDQTGDLAFDFAQTAGSSVASGLPPGRSFTDPSDQLGDSELDTRFLGDLYQDLSEHAKKTYALLQTPEFVESFILDRTLDPAIEEFGLDEVKMIDPTCGSGHFLLGAFDRLVQRWQDREPNTSARELAQRALDAVHGVDLNPFAVAIARFRLLVAALKVSGIRRLSDAPAFRMNLAAADSLLHGTRSDRLFGADDVIERLRQHHYAAEDPEEANRILQADQYHAVVGNPPYITVKDRALRDAIRAMYETAAGKFALSVPMTERFFGLALHGAHRGYVGMITANSFMKRSFGRNLVEAFLPTVTLTHIIDTSGAYIPGHGTPTVILLGRTEGEDSGSVRAVLGIRGEPGRPDDPSTGLVWTAILKAVDNPSYEDEYVSAEDVSRSRYARHPWSLQGGAAPGVFSRLKSPRFLPLSAISTSIGITSFTLEDDAFLMPPSVAERHGIPTASRRIMVTGDLVRDWSQSKGDDTIFPYDAEALQPVRDQLCRAAYEWLWPNKILLRNNKMFGSKTKEEAGLHWTEYGRLTTDKLKTPLSITFAFVATHNHFVLDRGGKVFNRSAPVIKLPADATEEDHLRLLGLLNSSTACFWMKQVLQKKTQMGGGGGSAHSPYSHQHEFDGTKLKQFPLPRTAPTALAGELDRLAQRLTDILPDAAVRSGSPTRDVLDRSRQQVREIRQRMVALQEELDWECYQHYAIIEDKLSLDPDRVPPIDRGERAFEIVLARRAAAGEVETSWFQRHGSTPITELPSHWPDDYRRMVERRIALIESDRAIGLLERPEYKRRWNWDDWDDLAKNALRSWLLDRLEGMTPAVQAEGEPRADADDATGTVRSTVWDVELTTTARLAERFRSDPEFLEAAQLYTGTVDVDLTDLVKDLVLDEAVPYLADYRYKPSGLKKRAAWEETWELQRAEDAIDAREDLSDEEKAMEKKAQGLDAIPVPPKYTASDFAKPTYWKLRGKLDVPKERFILYPGTRIGNHISPVIGWAGWNHLEQAQALAAHYTTRQAEGAEPDELRTLLKGLKELVPWLKQWHNDLDPRYGQRLGDFYEAFVQGEEQALPVA